MVVCLLDSLGQVKHAPHESMAMLDYCGCMTEVPYQGLQLLFGADRLRHERTKPRIRGAPAETLLAMSNMRRMKVRPFWTTVAA